MNDQGEELCIPGVRRCEGGAYHCVGGEAPRPEICDCKDNDCNDEIDEGDPCNGNGACLPGPHCQCAFRCAEGEFPCPAGYDCTTVDDPRFPAPNNRFCTLDRCTGVTCDDDENGNPTICRDGACVLLCDAISCPAETVCRPSDGICVEDNCNGFPERCAEGEYCLDGVCTTNPCTGVDCDGGQYCYEGDCVGSCAGVECPGGQSCELGACVDDLCAGVTCPQFQVCDPQNGQCVQSRCGGRVCPSGQKCDPLTGGCVVDRCNTVECPTGQVCLDGSCYSPDQVDPDPDPPRDFVLATGGGGCDCRVGSRGTPPGAALVLLIVPLLVLFRRRRGAR
jgi:MYXO-CTERM domain-containing protein